MTPLRQRFIEDLELRNLRENTKRAYVRAVAQFALFFGMSPELLGREQIREYLLYLIRDKKASESTYRQVLSAIRFLYRTTLGKDWVIAGIPHTKSDKKLPVVMSMDEVDRVFTAIVSLKHRAILMTAYAAGLRVSEVVSLRVSDIDSGRTMLRIDGGKGRRDRYVPLAVDGFDSRFPNPRLEHNGEKRDFNMVEYSSDLFSDFINDFMERNKGESFLVYYPMALTHCPFSPTPDSEDWDPASRGSRDYKGVAQYFKDMVAYADKTVGKIDAKLRSLGIRDNTLLIFIGDNGTDTPIVTNTRFGKVVGAKGSMIDGGNHVPCVVSWPGVIKEGTVTQDIIDVSDILPTVCEAAGIDLPRNIPFDGVSFLPQLQGTPGAPRNSIYMWYARNGGPDARVFARNQHYKLYSTGEFFHVPSDRLEKKKLADAELDDQAKAIKSMLRQKIASFASVEYLSSTTVKRSVAQRKKTPQAKKSDSNEHGRTPRREG